MDHLTTDICTFPTNLAAVPLYGVKGQARHLLDPAYPYREGGLCVETLACLLHLGTASLWRHHACTSPKDKKGLEAGEIVAENPACCTPEYTAQKAARLMMERQARRVSVIGERGAWSA